MTPLTDSGVDENVPGWAIRLEAKLDVALAQHSAQIERNTTLIQDVSARVRRMEDDPKVDPGAMLDHETRLRAQEARNYVSPRTFAATLFGVLGAMGALSPFIERFYS